MPWLAGRSDETAVMAESGLHALDHAVQLFVHVELDDHIVLRGVRRLARRVFGGSWPHVKRMIDGVEATEASANDRRPLRHVMHEETRLITRGHDFLRLNCKA